MHFIYLCVLRVNNRQWRKWLKFNLNPHWNYSRTVSYSAMVLFEKANHPLQHLVIEMSVYAIRQMHIQWIDGNWSERKCQTLLFFHIIPIRWQHFAVQESKECITTDVLHKIIVIYVANTRLSVIKSHIAPLENESNGREHVFNCHLTVMNVSDQPSIAKKKLYRNQTHTHLYKTYTQTYLFYGITTPKTFNIVFIFLANKKSTVQK